MRAFGIHRLKSIPFFLVHLTAAVGVFLVPFRWGWVLLCALLLFGRMFAITAGYHRYFSHRSYKMGRVAQFLMAWAGTTCVQKGVLWWAATHRIHHKYSDQPQDVHSPVQRGFWWSHAGWILGDQHEETKWDLIQDFAKYPELRWLNKHYLFPPTVLAIALLALGGWPALIWGFFVSTVLLWHATFTINSLAHVFGSRRYRTGDESRNNLLLAVLTFGEGWHNNHHAYMSSVRQGFFWWEIDVSYYLLKAMSWVGWVSDLREPPLALLENKRLGIGAGSSLGRVSAS